MLVSLVREPCAWYVSARKQRSRYAELESALDLWRRSASAALEAHRRWSGRVVVETYERLVRETESTMARLAERVGIATDPLLLTPTFNGRPIRANSSFRVERHGILVERADAGARSLDRDTSTRIRALAGDLYERAEAAALS